VGGADAAVGKQQAHREDATITDAAGWVQQQKTHRTITHMAVQTGRAVSVVKKKRVPAAGTKLPKQVNKERYAAIEAATLGVQGACRREEETRGV
jgi:hypothetical protein